MSPAVCTFAFSFDALTMPRAVVNAGHLLAAVVSLVATVTKALAVLALTLVVANFVRSRVAAWT